MKITAALSLALVLALSASAEAKRPKNGKYVERWPNGKTKLEGYYLNHRRDGYWTWYYKDGTVREKCRYIKARKHGLVEKFNEDGKVVSKTEWRHGVRHGSHVTEDWGTKGGRWVRRSKTTGSYHEGVRHSEWVIEWHDGRVQRIRYKRGQRAE